MVRRDPPALRLCLALLRLISPLVPRHSRADWQQEWTAEVRHRWQLLDGRHRLDWRAKMDLLRRALGALPDAAWIRRQFTADAEAVHDLRHGLRVLRSAPLFTLSTVLILAVGIAGTVSIASLLDTLLFRPLPYADADRVVTLWQRHAARGHAREDVSPANFLDWRERASSFTEIAAVVPYSYDLTGTGEPEVLFGAQVTERFWEAIGMPPALGRGFLPGEHVSGGRRAVVISHGLWQRRFGGDPAVLDRTLHLDGDVWTIVGVLPASFAPQMLPRPGELEVWTPKVVQPHETRTRGSAWWNVVARLAPGVTREAAQAEMDAISAALAREHPRTNEGLRADVVPLREHLAGGLRPTLLATLAAVLLVLAIGCANVASLMLARGLQREREFAIRAALGAGRARLLRQLVTESVLLAGIAAACGVAAAHWTIRAIVALAPGGVVRLQEAGLDGRLLAFAAAVTTLTAIACGLAPALQFSRVSAGAVGERAPGTVRAVARRGLVAAQVAVALVLLVGAGLLIRSFTRLLAVDPGFTSREVVAVQVFAWDRHASPDRLRTFFTTTLERMRAIPGVQTAGAVSAMPFMLANIDIRSPLAVVGREAGREDERREAYVTIATPGYFESLRIPLREGRLIEPRDSAQGAPVAVISDALRRREWPAESPLGRRIRVRWQGKPVEAEVVGVVQQVRHDGLDSPARAEVFLPHAQVPFASMTYVLRGGGDPAALINAAKQEIWSVDPLQTVYDTAALERMVHASLVRQRFSMTLMSGFAAVALLLCASGVYGLISFTTAQRTREIGVRMALGADAPTIRRMILREGGGLVAAGVLVGLVAALGVTRYLQSLLFDVRSGDPLTFALVSALLVAVGLAACYLPARRATRIDPLAALRVD